MNNHNLNQPLPDQFDFTDSYIDAMIFGVCPQLNKQDYVPTIEDIRHILKCIIQQMMQTSQLRRELSKADELKVMSAYALSLLESKEKSFDFLKRAGILDDQGDLLPHYK